MKVPAETIGEVSGAAPAPDSSSGMRASRPPAHLKVSRVILLLRRRWRTGLGLLLLVAFTSTLDISVPFVTQRLLDSIIRSVQAARILSTSDLILSVLCIFLAVAVTRGLRSFYNYRLFTTCAGIEDEIKATAFQNYLKLDTRAHKGSNSGQVIGSLDRGGTAVFVILYEILGQNLVPPLIVFIGVFSSLLLKNGWIALAVFLPLPIYLFIVGHVSSRLHELEKEVSQGFEQVSKESYDIASNVATVKKFSQEEREGAVQRKLLALARVPQLLTERKWALVENIQTLIATLARVTVIGFGGYMVLHKRCTVGEYVLFLALQDMLFVPMGQLSVLLPKLRRNVARAEGLFETYDRKPEIVDLPNALELPHCSKSIEFRDVSFKYEDAAEWALRRVNFRVPAGATVALIGRSGTGKSTLVNLLLRCFDPQQGAILVDGIDIRSVKQTSLRAQIAVVPQEVDLFSRTISENISYGSSLATSGTVEEAAAKALAHDFILRSEEGYRTVVGERGLRLSGGERQRIGIARAILRNPAILVLDEATSHLDTESEQVIQRATERMANGRTCFIIAHRLSTVRHADLVVVFGEQGIEASGTHQELCRTSATYRRLYELHSEGREMAEAFELAEAPAA